MKRAILLLTCVFLFSLSTAIAGTNEFSLFGARIGMSRVELDQIWHKQANDEYVIDNSILYKIRPEFDHRDRLYKLNFSFPLPLRDQYPAHMVSTAFQEKLSRLWDSESLAVTVRTGRGSAEVTVTDKALQKEFTDHINAQVEFQLTAILKP